MSKLNGRVARLEQAAQPEQAAREEKYPYWLSYPLATFQAGQVRPECYQIAGGRRLDWRIQGNYVHYFIDWLRTKNGSQIPASFETAGECRLWINEIGRALFQVKAWFDSQP